MADSIWRPPKTWKGAPKRAPLPDAELFDVARRSYRPTTRAMRALAAIPDAEAVWRPLRSEFACRYGCRGFRQHDGRIYHVWDCPYWWNEGKSEMPF